MTDLITKIGVGGCAIFGAIFFAYGFASMFAGRETPERQAELDRIEALMQRWLARRRS
jgi:hypothetical protein